MSYSAALLTDQADAGTLLVFSLKRSNVIGSPTIAAISSIPGVYDISLGIVVKIHGLDVVKSKAVSLNAR